MGHIALREDDRKLLLHLHDFIYSDKKFIDEHIYTSYTHANSSYNRLAQLVKEGYLRAFLLQLEDHHTKTSHVYTLGQLGAEQVEEMKGISHFKSGYLTGRAKPFWKHQLLLAESVKAFEVAAAQNEQGVQLKKYINEPRAFHEYPSMKGTKQKEVIRPDGIMVLGNEKGNLGIMIEMERSNSDKERTIRKIDQFNNFFARALEHPEFMDEYQRKVAFDERVDGWKILFIAADETKANKILRDLEDEHPQVPVLVASKQAIEENPFGDIYREPRDPNVYRKL